MTFSLNKLWIKIRHNLSVDIFGTQGLTYMKYKKAGLNKGVNKVKD